MSLAFNPKNIVNQIKETLGVNVAVIDKYGFILNSSIKGFKEGSVLSPTLLKFFNERAIITRDLNTKDVSSVVMAISDVNLVFTFGKKFILMCEVDKNVDLSKVLPSIGKILSLVDEGSEEYQQEPLIDVTIEKNITVINESIKNSGSARETKYKIFQDIIRQINDRR